jgi:murein DD-endopeptidase MepM/ murein hydrolase activator NlpD
MALRRTHAAMLAAGLVTAIAPASALGATSGGAAPPSTPSLPTPTVQTGTPADAGGSVAGRDESGSESKPASSKKPSSLDVASFALNGSHFYEYGRSLRATFTVGGKRGSAKLKLVFVKGGKRVKVVDMGEHAVGAQRSFVVPTAGLPEGAIDVRLSGRDSRGRALKGAPTRAIDVRSHRFPVAGAHTFGGEGSRFGADRDGGKRKHQGQDVSAPEGTPMVAARGGVVRSVANQPGGAGVYIVIRGAGESRDYVYMHLVEGSPTVRTGDTVRTGQLIGKVGQTGAASGPHLHFEIWQDAWQGGGTPIDPYPLLQRWDAWS